MITKVKFLCQYPTKCQTRNTVLFRHALSKMKKAMISLSMTVIIAPRSAINGEDLFFRTKNSSKIWLLITDKSRWEIAKIAPLATCQIAPQAESNWARTSQAEKVKHHLHTIHRTRSEVVTDVFSGSRRSRTNSVSVKMKNKSRRTMMRSLQMKNMSNSIRARTINNKMQYILEIDYTHRIKQNSSSSINFSN